MNTIPTAGGTVPPGEDPFAAFAPKKAISYLRVSTTEQATRGGREEGFSIPAQREANKRKARDVGAIIVREFSDKGVSGTSANRPGLKAMLAYIADHDVDYVIVHKLDRLARNRADDVDITRAIEGAGVRLVSTSEAIDETPGGLLMHGIMSSIAEFYSRNLAAEVVKGMTQKAKTGGTPGKVPLGYRNVRRDGPSGERRDVQLDPRRASLIEQAFRLYATGDWTCGTLADHLQTHGLANPSTPKYPARPVGKKQLYAILTNPYYRGVVRFQGVEYPGTHPALVDTETWLMVQAILTSKKSGEQTRIHNHWLKSTIVCGRCGSRMVVQHTTSRSGELYSYFYCNGRKHDPACCQLKSVLIHVVEQRVADIYQRISLTPGERTDIEQQLYTQIAEAQSSAIEERSHLVAQEATYRREQQQLLQAHYAGAISLDLLKTEQDRITRGLANVTRELEQIGRDTAVTKAHVSAALDLLEDCADTYRRAPAHVKKLLNQAFFKRILINPPLPGEQTTRVTSSADVRAVDQLNPYINWVLRSGTKKTSATSDGGHENTSETSTAGEPNHGIRQDIGFRPVTLVGADGLEPPTSCL